MPATPGGAGQTGVYRRTRCKAGEEFHGVDIGEVIHGFRIDLLFPDVVDEGVVFLAKVGVG